jgi:hypothetical protein
VQKSVVAGRRQGIEYFELFRTGRHILRVSLQLKLVPIFLLPQLSGVQKLTGNWLPLSLVPPWQ